MRAKPIFEDRPWARAIVAIASTFMFMAMCLAVIWGLSLLAPSADEEDVSYRYLPGALQQEEADSSDILQQPFYVLLIGSDSRRGTALYTGKASEHSQVDQHSDVMTLVWVDPVNLKLTFVTIPRDTWVEEANTKINEFLAAENDPQAVVDAVEHLTGVEISFYLMTSFIGFENIVDGLGGVMVDVPRTVTAPDPSNADDVTVDAGENVQLDGSEALVLARARKEYSGQQDGLRQSNVRALEQAIVWKGLELFADGGSGDAFSKAFSTLMESTETNMTDAQLASLVKHFAEDLDSVQILSGTGPYVGDYDEGLELWIVDPAEGEWSELMAVVDQGGDPNSVVRSPQFTQAD